MPHYYCIVPNMTVTLPITTFAREYAALLDAHPDDELVLERRAGKAAVVVRSLRLTQGDRQAVEAISHVLSQLLAHTDLSAAIADGLQDEFPWMALLPAPVRGECARELLIVLRASAALGRYGALHDTLDSWKATAEIYTDSHLVAQLTEPVDTPDGGDVPAPNQD